MRTFTLEFLFFLIRLVSQKHRKSRWFLLFCLVVSSWVVVDALVLGLSVSFASFLLLDNFSVSGVACENGTLMLV